MTAKTSPKTSPISKRPSPAMLKLLSRIAAEGAEGLPISALAGPEGPTFHRLRDAGLAVSRVVENVFCPRYRIHLTDAGRALLPGRA